MLFFPLSYVKSVWFTRWTSNKLSQKRKCEIFPSTFYNGRIGVAKTWRKQKVSTTTRLYISFRKQIEGLKLLNSNSLVRTKRLFLLFSVFAKGGRYIYNERREGKKLLPSPNNSRRFLKINRSAKNPRRNKSAGINTSLPSRGKSGEGCVWVYIFALQLLEPDKYIETENIKEMFFGLIIINTRWLAAAIS